MKIRTRNLRRGLILALSVFAFSPSFAATSFAAVQEESAEAETAEKEDAESTSETVSRLKESLRGEIEKLAGQYADAATEETRQVVIDSRRTIEKEHTDQLLTAIATRDSANRNIRDLVWFASRTKGEARESVVGIMMGKYLDSADMSKLVKALAKTTKPDEQVETWLTELSENSPVENVQAAATLGLANYLEQLEQAVANSDSKTESEYLKRRTPAELIEKIDSLLTTCAEKFPDTRSGQAAKTQLVQSNLKVGRTAPDIIGVDLDNVEFKLSDYRGKVVMIDFWGDW